MDLGEYMNFSGSFGQNPMENGSALSFNSRWKTADFGDYPFHPDNNSEFVGEAVVGDQVEFSVKLKNTKFLNPSFGTPETDDGRFIFSDFCYNFDMPREDYRRFDNDTAYDFEVSFGAGGEYTDWMNLHHARRTYGAGDYLEYSSFQPDLNLHYSWDYILQKFNVNITVPVVPGVGSDGLVRVYLRPALNNLYRETAWPLAADDVKKFRGGGWVTDLIVDESNDTESVVKLGDTLWYDGQTCTVTELVSSDETTRTASIKVDIALDSTVIDSSVYIELETPLSQNEMDPMDLSLSNIDNDSAGFIISQISNHTREDGTEGTFMVRLAAAPSSDVTFGISCGDTSEGALSANSLSFINSNWNEIQTVPVSGVDDSLFDGFQDYKILLAIDSILTTDTTGYKTLDPGDVSVVNSDDEMRSDTGP